uniref:Uncharacterized protein n=1 Tax=Placozoa sp. H9 HM-2017 TaxID=2017597 RepID=A0A7I6N463_9METZ|nr:hypothetical protein [Placozoa sp. H9 HM-2017]
MAPSYLQLISLYAEKSPAVSGQEFKRKNGGEGEPRGLAPPPFLFRERGLLAGNQKTLLETKEFSFGARRQKKKSRTDRNYIGGTLGNRGARLRTRGPPGAPSAPPFWILFVC